MKSKILNFIKFFIGWPLSAIAIFFIVKLIIPKLPSILPRLIHLDIKLLLISIFFFQLYFFLRTILWKKLLDYKDHPLPLRESGWSWMLSEIKRYIPGNVWSVLGRVTLFSKFGIKKTTIGALMTFELQYILIGSFTVSLLAYSFIFYNFLPNIFETQTIFKLFIALLLLIFLLFTFYPQIIKISQIKHPFLIRIINYVLFIRHMNLFMLSIFVFICFSLGTYFSILSVIYLSPTYLLTFLGLFSFSYFIGFMSFITPTGIGVREGIMILGLAKFILLPEAAFASVFTRVVLILSELIYLIFAYFWKVLLYQPILSIEKFIYRYRYEIILIGFILGYIIYFNIASFARYNNFFAGRFDLGNMDQVVWNTLHGRLFQLTDPNGTDIISRLSVHADFILVLLVPFYYFWKDPQMLLIIQTVILSLGSYFVFLIGNKVLKNKYLSLILGILYLLNPSIGYTNLYDFHAVTLATTFLLGAWYFLISKKYYALTIFLILAALTKEQVWLTLTIFAVYIFIKQGKRFYALCLFLISCFMFYYLLWHAIPDARGGQHFALAYYSDFGTTPSAVIKNILLNPQKIFFTLFNSDRLLYLKQLFLPVGILPLFAPFYLLFAMSDWIINLLSNNAQLHEIYYQYTAVISSFIFISTIYGIKNLLKFFPKLSIHILIYYLLAMTLISIYFFGPLPGSKQANIDMFTKQNSDRVIIENYLNNIPKRFSVSASNNLGAHLSHRQYIYTVPLGLDKADIITFLLTDSSSNPSLKEQEAMVDKVKQNKNYTLVFSKDNFLVFKKKNISVRIKK